MTEKRELTKQEQFIYDLLKEKDELFFLIFDFLLEKDLQKEFYNYLHATETSEEYKNVDIEFIKSVYAEFVDKQPNK